MRISIITPSYNQAPYLEQTIRSVLQQDCEDLEYFIVDGGSTDGSVDIIRRYEDRLAWWVSEPDKGQADAINKGMARATGEIVAWLNSDDLYHPDAIAEALSIFKTHPEAGLVYGNAVSIDSDGRPLNDMVFAPYGPADLAAFNIICQPAVFFRKEIWDHVGGLDPQYHLLLDHHLWLRMSTHTKMHHVPHTWAFARQHPGAKNVALAPKFGEEAMRILAWMKTDPHLVSVYHAQPRRVQAAAERFNARYLLDGGLNGPAFRAYLRALAVHPAAALVEWHRILFAGLSLIGLGKLGKLYYSLKRKRLPASMQGVTNVQMLYNPPPD